MSTVTSRGDDQPVDPKDFLSQVEAAAAAMKSIGYPPTKQQREYMWAVAETLERGRTRSRSAQGAARTAVRAIEASTGTGKSLGYLVPLFLYCAIYGERTGVAVGTIPLQNQLFGVPALAGHRQPSYAAGDRSDMAIAAQVLGILLPDAQTPYIVVRRGMANYVCPQRVSEIVEEAGPELLEDPVWREFYNWAMKVGSWDPVQQQLDITDGLASLGYGLLINATLPRGVTANEVCIRSAREANGNPIYQMMRTRSKEADIVIQTHVSCLLDAMHDHSIFNWVDEESGEIADGERPISALVMDEADQAEIAGDLVSRYKLPIYRIVARTGKWLEQALPEAVAKGVRALHESAVATQAWFAVMHRKSIPDRESDEFLVIERRPGDLHAAEEFLLRMQSDFALIAAAIKGRKAAALDATAHTDLDEWSRGVERIVKHLREVRARGADSEKRLDRALSLCWSPKKHMASFQMSEPFPARRFALHFSHRKDGSRDGFLDSVIFTSATITTPAARPFADFYRSIGLITENEDSIRSYAHDVLPEKRIEPDRFGTLECVYLAHPFAPYPTLTDPAQDDIDNQDDLPNYTNPVWVEYVSFVLEQLIVERPKEPVLALATSFRGARLIFESLRNRNPEAAQRLFAHERGMSEGLAAGIRSLRSGAASVLLTPSAWQGQDIRHEDKSQMLRHVVVTNLPFAPPDSIKEHMQIALMSRYPGISQERIRGILRAQAIRRAWARLRQAIGRLHRHPKDRGSIWILDKRAGLPESLMLSMGVFPTGKRTTQEELRKQDRYCSMGMLKAFPARFSRVVSAASVVAPEFARGKTDALIGVKIIDPPKPFAL